MASFCSGFWDKSYVHLLSPSTLHTLHISSFVWSLKQYFVKSRDFESPHNIMFVIPVLPFPFRPTYHSQHPIFIHHQPIFLPPCERSGLTPNANITVNHVLKLNDMFYFEIFPFYSSIWWRQNIWTVVMSVSTQMIVSHFICVKKRTWGKNVG